MSGKNAADLELNLQIVDPSASVTLLLSVTSFFLRT